MYEDMQVFDDETFYAAFVADLNQARGQVLIMSSYLTTRQLERVQKPIVDCVARNVRVCVFLQEDRYWKQRKEFPKPRLRDTEDAIQKLESMGVHVTLLKRVHVKIIVVDEDIYWFGTMNILSHFDTIEEMQRSRNRLKVEDAIRKYRLDLCSPCVANSPFGLLPGKHGIAEHLQYIGRCIAHERRKVRMTQVQLAQAAKVGQNIVSDVEHGKRNIKIDSLSRILSVLRLKLYPVPWYLQRSVEEQLASELENPSIEAR
jgi:hypothetical protein